MKDPVTYFFSDLNYQSRAAIFKKLLYLFVIAQCIYWLINYDLLFGENSVITSREFDIGFIKGLAFFLYHPQNSSLCLMAIIAALILSLLSLLKIKLYFIFDFILWLLVLNLHNRVYPTLTGGNYFLNQLLFFNCFISFVFPNKNTTWHQLKTCFHNFAILAIIIQVCFLYCASGLLKLNDSEWMSGEAFSLISGVNHYNTYTPVRFSENSNLPLIITFVVIFYQLLFPILIWFSSIKKIMILIGICMHLYIALVMGLLSFGLVMLIPYVFFWPSKKQEISNQ
ncbi:MAG: hypothetical protein JWO32_1399 [Bacteroidetes bacterium]|nr:hypothetical protein [Bacteroidota bacterium]